MSLDYSFDQLSAAATRLNRVSDEMTLSVGALEDRLKQTNAGIEAWVEVHLPKPNAEREVLEVGYQKHDGKWGIYVRHVDLAHGERGPQRFWRFSDAPRIVRALVILELCGP